MKKTYRGTREERKKPFNWKKCLATAIITASLGYGVEYSVFANYINRQPTPSQTGRINPEIPDNNERDNGIIAATISKPNNKANTSRKDLESVTETEANKVENEIPLEPYNPGRTKTPDQEYTYREILEVARVLYAEAANQTESNRRLIARTIINRMHTSGYPKTVWSNIHDRNAFSCTFNGSNLWAQAKGKKKMNQYEQKVFDQCMENAKEVMQKKKTEEITGEAEIVAYHDSSIKQPNDKYWDNLKPVYRAGRLTFYVNRN